jgi:ceramide glucosyltransferase
MLWSLSAGLTLWGTWYALRQITRELPLFDNEKTPYPISILKPLKGAEAGMEANIESYFRIDYSSYELLFSVADSRDPAREIVETMRARYPHVSSQLIEGDVEVGPNPKINNLIQSYARAKYDWILISDSNTRADPNYLKRLMPHLTSDAGVVTAVVAGTHPVGVGGQLEATYLNTFFARWTHVAAALGKPFVIGKSMCFRKSTAERFGGIYSLAPFIAEDNMMGQAMLRLGFKVVVMADPIAQFIGRYSFKSFWLRHIRWGRIRKSQAPLAFLMEPFVNALVSGVTGAFALHALLGFPFLPFLAAHLSVWALCDLLMIQRLQSRINLRVFFIWILREALAFPLWVHMACGNTVTWRGNRLKILAGGLVTTSPIK